MSYEDLSGDEFELPIYTAAQMTCLVSFYHYARGTMYVDTDEDFLDPAILNDLQRKMYEFQLMHYDPEAPVLTWRKRREQGSPEDRKLLESWNKNVRISIKDFPVFKEAIYWNKFKRSYLVAIESYNLQDLMNPAYKPTSPSLHKAQCGWVYKMQQDTFLEPYARSVVIAHTDDKNVAKIWLEVCTYHDSSMTNGLRVLTISNYITSVRLHKLDFRGNVSTWLLNYVEQIRLHNEMVEHDQDKISEGQSVNFLEAAVMGVDKLSQVRTSWTAAQKGAGRVGARLKLSEYLELLLNQASIIDAPKSRATSSKYRANVSEYIFEDEDEQEDVYTPDSSGAYDVSNHEFTIDSPPEYMMYLTERNNGGAKKKAWLDKKSWMAMSQEDRSVWDQLSDSAKATIRSAYQNVPSNGNRKPLPSRRSSVNNHELQDHNEGKEENETEETTTLQATTHERGMVFETEVDDHKSMEPIQEHQQETIKGEEDLLSYMARKAESKNSKNPTDKKPREEKNPD